MGSRHVNQEPGLVLGQQLDGVSDSTLATRSA
jgi:hypothetical protein